MDSIQISHFGSFGLVPYCAHQTCFRCPSCDIVPSNITVNTRYFEYKFVMHYVDHELSHDCPFDAHYFEILNFPEPKYVTPGTNVYFTKVTFKDPKFKPTTFQMVPHGTEWTTHDCTPKDIFRLQQIIKDHRLRYYAGIGCTICWL